MTLNGKKVQYLVKNGDISSKRMLEYGFGLFPNGILSFGFSQICRLNFKTNVQIYGRIFPDQTCYFFKNNEQAKMTFLNFSITY